VLIYLVRKTCEAVLQKKGYNIGEGREVLVRFGKQTTDVIHVLNQAVVREPLYNLRQCSVPPCHAQSVGRACKSCKVRFCQLHSECNTHYSFGPFDGVISAMLTAKECSYPGCSSDSGGKKCSDRSCNCKLKYCNIHRDYIIHKSQLSAIATSRATAGASSNGSAPSEAETVIASSGADNNSTTSTVDSSKVEENVGNDTTRNQPGSFTATGKKVLDCLLVDKLCSDQLQ
jgi:hypothetical protein